MKKKIAGKELTVAQKVVVERAKRLAKLDKEQAAIRAATDVPSLQAAVAHLVGTPDLALLTPLVSQKMDMLIGV